VLTSVEVLGQGLTSQLKKGWDFVLFLELIIRFIPFLFIILQVDALLQTLELRESAQHKGQFALQLFAAGSHQVQRGAAGSTVYCNPFPEKQFYGSHRLDLVMIGPPGIHNGAFLVSPDTVWYARTWILLLFSAAAMTDTGSKSFDCALVSTLETYDDPENGDYINYTHYIHFWH
jgi:hypothetical protein